MTFHLAIPAFDLDQSRTFYKSIGASIGREYSSHVVLDFFETQLVLHKVFEAQPDPKMYPRHFGIILENYDKLMLMHGEVLEATIRLWEPLFTRNEGEFAEHMTFFICDPSNNLIEFKSYKNPEAIFT